MKAPNWKHLIDRIEVAAGMPMHIDTDLGSFIITVTPVKDKFRTNNIDIEYVPVNGKVLHGLTEERRN